MVYHYMVESHFFLLFGFGFFFLSQESKASANYSVPLLMEFD